MQTVTKGFGYGVRNEEGCSVGVLCGMGKKVKQKFVPRKKTW